MTERAGAAVIQLVGCLRNLDMPKLSLILVIAVVAVGCGSDADQPTTPRAASPAASQGTMPSDGTIAIEDFKFVPEEVTVDVGTTVTWTNEDAAPHTATADDGSFDTGNLREGDAGEVTFGKAGSFAYFCEFHKFMRAKITVR